MSRTNRTIIVATREAGTNDVTIKAGNGNSDFLAAAPVATTLTPEVGESTETTPLLVKLVHQGGACEVQWSSDATTETKLDGLLLIHPDGMLTVKWADDAGNYYVFVLDGNSARIVETEDQPPTEDAPVAWEVKA